MEFDYSWKALYRPGEADNFFDMANPPAFQSNATRYSPINAWWLSEFSRLIYRQDADEIGERANLVTRKDIMRRFGFDETHFFNRNGMQAGLINGRSERNQSFSILVFRGTNCLDNWLSNLNAIQTDWENSGMVHAGFKKAFIHSWEEIQEELNRLQTPIFYAGHSLGAAMAILAAAKKPPTAAYTFGAPRVGNTSFGYSFKKTKIFRVVNHQDIVATVPVSMIPFEFSHVGTLHYIASNGRMIENPGVSTLLYDRSKKNNFQMKRKRFTTLPDFLADHAPVNYSAHLERQILM